MKKKTGLLLLILSAALITAGCTNKTDVSTQTQTNNQPNQQMPIKRADINGSVTSIVGNELTVEKMVVSDAQLTQMAQFTGIPRTGQGRPGGGDFGGGNAGFGGGGAGFPPGGQNGGTTMTDAERTALRASRMADVKTEPVNITIPIGVPITKRTRGTNGAGGEEITATISDIVKGSSIMVWLDASGTPERVVINN